MTGLFNQLDDSNQDDKLEDQTEVDSEDLQGLDPKELARRLVVAEKRLVDKDEFIETLKRETNDTRKELNQRMTIEQFMETMKNTGNQASANTSGDANNGSDNSNNAQSLKQEDVASLVRNLLEQEKKQSSKQDNVAYVARELTKAWGPKYSSKLKEKAQELGGEEFLGSLAETNPKAFLKLLDVTGEAPRTQSPNTQNPPTNRMNSTAMASSNASSFKTYKDFDKLRRENPKLFYSPQVQSERLRLAKELGDKFYS